MFAFWWIFINSWEIMHKKNCLQDLHIWQGIAHIQLTFCGYWNIVLGPQIDMCYTFGNCGPACGWCRLSHNTAKHSPFCNLNLIDRQYTDIFKIHISNQFTVWHKAYTQKRVWRINCSALQPHKCKEMKKQKRVTLRISVNDWTFLKYETYSNTLTKSLYSKAAMSKSQDKYIL